MRGTILYLEQNIVTRQSAVEHLCEKGYHGVDFGRIDQVKEHLENYPDDVRCLITGLRNSTFGLGEFAKNADSGFMSGWVMLERFIFLLYPSLPVIIYAPFLEELDSYLDGMGKRDMLNRPNLTLVPLNPWGNWKRFDKALAELNIKLV